MLRLVLVEVGPYSRDPASATDTQYEWHLLPHLHPPSLLAALTWALELEVQLAGEARSAEEVEQLALGQLVAVMGTQAL
jgi:hypothetical protein